MKTKIVYEDFNSETGVTTVTIQNKYGHFTGKARCCPEDLPTYSMFQGERIAATYANIKFCKEMIKREKIKIKAYDEIFHKLPFISIKNEKDLSKEKIKAYQDSIEILRDSIKKIDKERQDVLLRSKKNK